MAALKLQQTLCHDRLEHSRHFVLPVLAKLFCAVQMQNEENDEGMAHLVQDLNFSRRVSPPWLSTTAGQTSIPPRFSKRWVYSKS